MDSEFGDSITHVVTPPHGRTLKTLAACLTSKWLITDFKWIIDSYEKGHFLPEDAYGERHFEHPFKVRFE
jgi:hypothetical protein